MNLGILGQVGRVETFTFPLPAVGAIQDIQHTLGARPRFVQLWVLCTQIDTVIDAEPGEAVLYTGPALSGVEIRVTANLIRVVLLQGFQPCNGTVATNVGDTTNWQMQVVAML